MLIQDIFVELDFQVWWPQTKLCHVFLKTLTWEPIFFFKTTKMFYIQTLVTKENVC
jgi:hypothetical protein